MLGSFAADFAINSAVATRFSKKFAPRRSDRIDNIVI
jgi:hypothetical protein